MESLARFKNIPHLEQCSEEHLTLVAKIVQKISKRLPQHISRDDLFHAGVLGLLDALKRFDPDITDNFMQYAQARIRGSILDELRRADMMARDARRQSKHIEKTIEDLRKKLGREASDEELACSLKISLIELQHHLDKLAGVKLLSFDEKTTSQSPYQSPFEETAYQELLNHLKAAIDKLSLKEQTLLRLYYQESLTMREIGVIINVGESRVSQLLTRITIHLRQLLSAVIKEQVYD
jgi:RNA polymerase sigma factor for flagellar operon FliA